MRADENRNIKQQEEIVLYTYTYLLGNVHQESSVGRELRQYIAGDLGNRCHPIYFNMTVTGMVKIKCFIPSLRAR